MRFKKTQKQIEACRLIANNRVTCLAGGSRCFTKDQLVVTDNGNKKISEILEGDRVLSYNETTKNNEYKKVIKKHNYKNNKKYLIKINLKNGEYIEGTFDHKIYFNGEWITLQEVVYIYARGMGNNTDGLCTDDIGNVEITENNNVYDLTIEDNHNYYIFAGKNILVHNSGKSVIAIYTILARASFEKTRHLVTRYRFAHAKQSLCYDTIPKVIELMGLEHHITLNKTDWFYELWNGSTIWIGGLDDKERTEKILGNEYASIFLNEASQISYEAYEMITTRLNPPHGVKGKIIIDYNPPSISHWGYKMFVEHKLPDGTELPKDDYSTIQMNPSDNLENISEDYIEQLQYLSAAKRKRFLDGEYTSDMGSLWKRGWIKYDETIHDYERVVVGVDPAGTVGGDEIGIIVSGKIGDNYYVLDDYSLHGTPNEWALEVKNAYEKWKADVVVAEKNYGGDMVESTIRQADRNINVKLINSSRGKIIRAEPVSALYEQGKVYHRQPLYELEDELCNYTPEKKESPNRLDSLVFSITELSGKKSINYEFFVV